ncbi:phage capsid protein [Listeria newyorkensis]|uniref:Phage capsid protein n=2 Tax=Listeria newyorkensis TaxID=1497681 RepID=A0ABX4XKT6_9LIST|nr:phage capsid protein [Listeria newyorkensis]
MLTLQAHKQAENELKGKFVNTMREGSEEQQVEAFAELSDAMMHRIMAEARETMNAGINDTTVLSQRGFNPLTTDEQSYYNEVIAGNGFAGTEKLMPPTVFQRVFENLVAQHPLLAKIDFVNTTATTEWIISIGDVQTAWWGPLCAEIKEVLDKGFDKVSTSLYKLSAYIPICNAMLDLGAEWLDLYVRTVLAESMALGLEFGIIAGTGKDQPIGMMKDIKNVSDGEYVDKSAVVLPNLKPLTLAQKIMVPLTREGKRSVSDVLLIVNPLDYWAKIWASTVMLTPQGTYVAGILPIPATIIESSAVPVGRLVAGLGNDYFMGIGSEQQIKTSDQVRLLDDETIYYAKQYATGRPKDNESFYVFNIEDMDTSLAFDVNVTNPATPIPTPEA